MLNPVAPVIARARAYALWLCGRVNSKRDYFHVVQMAFWDYGSVVS